MSYYPTTESFLQDARLQAEALGPEYGVLVVEGETDKSFFAKWCARTVAQILVADGRPTILRAQRAMLDKDKGRLLFIVDCDGDSLVPRGLPELVITEHNDLEADLVLVDRLARIVAQVVGGTLMSEERLATISDQVLERSAAAAVAVGRVRRAAREAAVGLKAPSHLIKFDRFREAGTADTNVERALAEVIRAHNETAEQTGIGGALADAQISRIEVKLPLVNVQMNTCLGKDLIAAAATVLRADFRVRKHEIAGFDALVRGSISESLRDQLEVVRRVRLWEARYGVRILS